MTSELTQLREDVKALADIANATNTFLASAADQLVMTTKFVSDFVEMQHQFNERISSMIGALCLVLEERGIATQEEIMQARLKAVGILDQAAAGAEERMRDGR